MRRFGLAAALVLATCGGAAAQQPCGGSDGACALADGVYFAQTPQAAEGAPWVLYLHGYGGSAAQMAANAAMVDAYRVRGYALIHAPGRPQPARRAALLVAAPREPDGASRAHAARRRGLPARGRRGRGRPLRARPAARARRRVLARRLHGLGPRLRGARHGGRLRAGRRRLLGPAPGVLRRPGAAPPHPRLLRTRWCPSRAARSGRGPIRFGRAISTPGSRSGARRWAARRTRTCTRSTARSGARPWTTCAEGGLGLVLFPGGHRVPEGWTDLALDWFEGGSALEASPPRGVRRSADCAGHPRRKLPDRPRVSAIGTRKTQGFCVGIGLAAG